MIELCWKLEPTEETDRTDGVVHVKLVAAKTETVRYDKHGITPKVNHCNKLRNAIRVSPNIIGIIVMNLEIEMIVLYALSQLWR